MRWRDLIFLFAATAGMVRASEALTFSSGSRQVALLELFTSEGCSSCPPAEDWLATKRNDAELWRAFVPVSWHVDYWDRLGWRDRFASRTFTERQYAWADAWGNGSVYTPCFVRNGKEWRPIRTSIADDSHDIGVLTVQYDGATVRTAFTPSQHSTGDASKDRFTVYAVLLGGGIRSKVTAGENDGATLTHEFVALQLASGPLERELALPRTRTAGVARYALAVWITREDDLAPLQAAGGWLR